MPKHLFVLLLLLYGFTIQYQQPVTIYLAGDSTMSDKSDPAHPERGWGMLLPEFFTEEVKVENHAKNGRSTRTFRSEGRWQAIMDKVEPEDYVVIQFGHNDSSPKKVKRYTSPEQYKANLIRFVEETRARQAKPILCTPIMRRRFDDRGKFYDTHGVYPDIVRQVAGALEVPMVDMHRKSEKLIIQHGEAQSKKLFLHFQAGDHPSLPEGLKDDTHFSEYGARKMAGLFVEGIRELDLELAQYVKSDE